MFSPSNLCPEQLPFPLKNSHKTSHLDIYTKYIVLLIFVMSCLLSLQGKPARKCLKMTQKSQHRRRKNCSSWFLSKKSFSQGSKKKLDMASLCTQFSYSMSTTDIIGYHSGPFYIRKVPKILILGKSGTTISRILILIKTPNCVFNFFAFGVCPMYFASFWFKLVHSAEKRSFKNWNWSNKCTADYCRQSL